MATKHDEFKIYYFSFTDDEIVSILAALRCHGEEDLADEIGDQVYLDRDCDCGESIDYEQDLADRAVQILEGVYRDAEINRVMFKG